VEHVCGLYEIKTKCGELFFYEVKPGHYEIDIFCPICMEHKYTFVVRGDVFEPISYFGKGLRLCSSLNNTRLTLTSSPN
jgi:hypothetical protein